ncbi:carboxypeptidase-like regulatory domain-containing protein [Salisaeta longa]|uniref:carboxypeptidase-like regulatory domain-containing protein n=1 Tax=Salisaeta longa TaxID=503170 RepID=UPI00146A60A0|nr:carboxypeptidase-like regulatory domain-containing protein [Salisaeta longa]
MGKPLGRWIGWMLWTWAVLGMTAQAQPTVLTGRVLDAGTGAPLQDAHVFLGRSLEGTATDAKGRFTIVIKKPRAIRLMASMVGYKPQERAFLLQTRDTTYQFTFRLQRTVIPMAPVEVRAARDDDWWDHLGTFQRLFLGTSHYAERCYLVNPEALTFDTRWWGRFRVAASGPLVIENRALGYRLVYALKAFERSGDVVRWDGAPTFYPLTPASPAEARRWRAARRRAYYGSVRHLMRSLMAGTSREEGFVLEWAPRAGVTPRHRRPRYVPVDPTTLLTPLGDSTYALDFSGRLKVVYRREAESDAYLDWAGLWHTRGARSVQTSHIVLNEDRVHVDRFGDIVEPYGATVYGYFAFERIAELLPVEYRPPGTGLRSRTSADAAVSNDP